MPPRSANRKVSAAAKKPSSSASTKPKKSTPKSKQPGVQSIISEETTVSEVEDISKEEIETQQDVKVLEAEEAATAKSEIEQQIEALGTSSMEGEGLVSGGEDKVVVTEEVTVSTVVEVEVQVKEEVVTEEKTMNTVIQYTENVVEHGGVAGEEREGMGGEQNEGGGDENDGYQADRDAEQNSVEEEPPATEIEDTIAPGDGDDITGVKEGGDGEGEGEMSGDDKEDNEEDNQEENEEDNEEENEEDNEEENEEDNEEDEDPSEFTHVPLTDRKKQKDLEIFIGGLDKGADEEDLIKVFGKFGEIQGARVVKHPTTKKSKGFAFIRYATVEQAKKALSELKDGIEVRGKHVKISASQDNDTLYMGNICRTWSKEHVLETLKGFGIEQIEEIHLPDDPKNEGKIKGFALLEFSTHSGAMAAFQRLRKPDAVFGRDRSAKVAFAQTPMHPNEEVLSQVKTVYVEGLTNSWDEEKLKDICKQYGEVEKVKLSRNLGKKRKDFGFIDFTSRESALACVEGINNAQIGEGEVKVKANIAKPQFRGRLQKQGTRGGFQVKDESEKTEQAGSSRKKGHAKSKGVEKREKALAEEKGKKALPKLKSAKGGKPNKPQTRVSEGQGVGAPSKPESKNRKRKNLPSKVDGRGKRNMDHGYSKRPSKKPRGNMRGRKNDAFRNQRSNPHHRKGTVYEANPVAYGNPYAAGYAASTSSYPGHAYSAISGSKRRHSDMEPHAGYLEPAVGKQGRTHAGYLEPAIGTQGRPRAGYLEPAVKQGHDPYGYGMRRASGYDGQGSSGSTYGGGSALPPSYVPNYTSYAGYEGGHSAGDYYGSSGAYLPRRAYY